MALIKTFSLRRSDLNVMYSRVFLFVLGFVVVQSILPRAAVAPLVSGEQLAAGSSYPQRRVMVAILSSGTQSSKNEQSYDKTIVCLCLYVCAVLQYFFGWRWCSGIIVALFVRRPQSTDLPRITVLLACLATLLFCSGHVRVPHFAQRP